MMSLMTSSMTSMTSLNRLMTVINDVAIGHLLFYLAVALGQGENDYAGNVLPKTGDLGGGP